MEKIMTIVSQKRKPGVEADPKAPQIDAVEKQRIEESRLVRGVFQANGEGGHVRFPFKKFKGDPIVDYHFIDGQEYEIPLAVVRHLNSNCFYSEDQYMNGLLGPDGKPLKNPNRKKRQRFSFKLLEHMDKSA